MTTNKNILWVLGALVLGSWFVTHYHWPTFIIFGLVLVAVAHFVPKPSRAWLCLIGYVAGLIFQLLFGFLFWLAFICFIAFAIYVAYQFLKAQPSKQAGG
jgi:hypothetical protein